MRDDFDLVLLWLKRAALFAAPGIAITIFRPRLSLYTAACLLIAVTAWPFLAAAMPSLERSTAHFVTGSIVLCCMASLLGVLGFSFLHPYLGIQFRGHSALGAEGPVVIVWWLILLLSLLGAIIGPRLFVSSLAVGAFAPERPRSPLRLIVGSLLLFTILGAPVWIFLTFLG